jgi:hypothetical protein
MLDRLVELSKERDRIPKTALKRWVDYEKTADEQKTRFAMRFMSTRRFADILKSRLRPAFQALRHTKPDPQVTSMSMTGDLLNSMYLSPQITDRTFMSDDYGPNSSNIRKVVEMLASRAKRFE